MFSLLKRVGGLNSTASPTAKKLSPSNNPSKSFPSPVDASKEKNVEVDPAAVGATGKQQEGDVTRMAQTQSPPLSPPLAPEDPPPSPTPPASASSPRRRRFEVRVGRLLRRCHAMVAAGASAGHSLSDTDKVRLMEYLSVAKMQLIQLQTMEDKQADLQRQAEASSLSRNSSRRFPFARLTSPACEEPLGEKPPTQLEKFSNQLADLLEFSESKQWSSAFLQLEAAPAQGSDKVSPGLPAFGPRTQGPKEGVLLIETPVFEGLRAQDRRRPRSSPSLEKAPALAGAASESSEKGGVVVVAGEQGRGRGKAATRQRKLAGGGGGGGGSSSSNSARGWLVGSRGGPVSAGGEQVGDKGEKAGSMHMQALETEQKELLEDVGELAGSLKESVRRINKTLKKDSKVVDDTESLVDKNLADAKKEVARLQKLSSSSNKNTCLVWMMLFAMIGIFVGTYFVMRFVPKFNP